MRIFHNVTEADRRLWKAPLVSQLFPFLWAEPHHADVSLFCEDRSWQNDFSNSRSRITAWVARFLLKRSWRTVPVARYLTNVSVCFLSVRTYRQPAYMHRLTSSRLELLFPQRLVSQVEERLCPPAYRSCRQTPCMRPLIL